METSVAVRQVELPMELSINDLLTQVMKIQEIMNRVMKKDEHFGVIPGTNKPTLLKPGAEKLCLVFRLDPQYESTERYDGDHLTIKSKCTLYHIPTQLRIGSGEGSCSSKESKYAFRNAQLACPDCGKETVFKSKHEAEGYYCWQKKGGCGATFPPNQFDGVELGKVANDNLADQYNTILKMANKRSLIAAVLNATAASDIFTQDLEDMVANGMKFSQPEKPAEKQPEKKPDAPFNKWTFWNNVKAYCKNDKTAGDMVKELTGKSRMIKNITDAEAVIAQKRFEQEILKAPQLPTDEEIPFPAE